MVIRSETLLYGVVLRRGILLGLVQSLTLNPFLTELSFLGFRPDYLKNQFIKQAIELEVI